MDFVGKKIGYAVTGSFCTFDKTLRAVQNLVDLGADVYPIFSYSCKMDTRFTTSNAFVTKMREICGKNGIISIQEAEPIGPKSYLDIVVIAPCTGNTLAKLANGITDSPVLMAAKAHLRNEKPLLLAISTNDALSMNLKNIGQLMNMKHIYFVPFGQDDHEKKPNSMIAHLELLPESIAAALKERQLQPILVSRM